MKKIIYIFTLFFISLNLVGCITANQWYRHPMAENKTTIKEIAKDNIKAFAQVTKASEQFKKDDLIMVGESYLFVLNKNSVDDILPILRNENTLFESLVIDTNKEKEMKYLPINVTEDGKHFKSSFCLKYNLDSSLSKNKQNEQKKLLKELSFSEGHYGIEKCFDISGDIFSNAKPVKTDTNFSQFIPVVLQYEVSTKEFSGTNTAFNILMTPISLVSDAILTPLAILAISADKAAGR